MEYRVIVGETVTYQGTEKYVATATYDHAVSLFGFGWVTIQERDITPWRARGT